MDVIENESYYRLLLMYKRVLPVDSLIPAGSAGAASVQDATVQYGAGAWHLINGRTREARELFSRIVEGSAWPAFGHVAAEAELARTPR
jgi:hypothetical protein